MKLLVCDVEGTIFAARYKIDGVDYASTMWQPLAQSLGEEGVRREAELAHKWETGGYNGIYLNWVNETYSEVHKPLGLKKGTFDSLINQAEYIPGVKDFFSQLDHSQYIPVLISGGFQELVRRAQKELNIPHGHGACEYFFNPVETIYYNKITGKQSDFLLTRLPVIGKLLYRNMPCGGELASKCTVPCDFGGKYEYVKYLFDVYNLDPATDWVFIGDGKNDCDIASRAPISFSINGHEKLKKVVTYSVDKSGQEITSFNQINEVLKSLSDNDFKLKCTQNPQVSDPKKEKQYLQEQIDKLKAENEELWQELNSTLEKSNSDLMEKDTNIETLKSKIADNDKQLRKLSNENEILQKDRTYLQKTMGKKLPIKVEENDETEQPPRTLSELLENRKVVFVGLKKDYQQFQYLNKKYKNLIVISSGSKQKDFSSMKVDFLFVFTGCIDHPTAKKAIKELKVPYVHINTFRNSEKLVNIMANVLFRAFF